MHAHPFGLIFYKQPNKAALWAAEHSKLTHGSPIALAASAAMAEGVAFAVQKKKPEFILQKMYEAAKVYDEQTANMIKEAVEYSKNEAITSEYVFEKFWGWRAHEAITATAYIFAVSHDDLKKAIYLGVHTPGDSDSIASMAGALVGAYSPSGQLDPSDIAVLENSILLKAIAHSAARKVNQNEQEH